MAVDIFTKAITKIPAWEHALRLIGIVDAESKITRSLEHEKKLSLSPSTPLILANTVLSCACILSKSSSLLPSVQSAYHLLSASSVSSSSDSSFDIRLRACQQFSLSFLSEIMSMSVKTFLTAEEEAKLKVEANAIADAIGTAWEAHFDDLVAKS